MATKFVKVQRLGAPHKRVAVFEWKKYKPIVDVKSLERIVEAWNVTKSPLGYTSYTDIYIHTHIPYSKIFGVLKCLHNADPHSIIFNINRMGQNVYFKLVSKKVVR